MLLSELIKSEFNDNKCHILIYKISTVILAEYDGSLSTEDIDVYSNDVLELFVFNKDKEVKYRKGCDITISKDSKDFIDEEVFLNNKFKSNYKTLVERNNLEYSEDNIVYFKYSRAN